MFKFEGKECVCGENQHGFICVSMTSLVTGKGNGWQKHVKNELFDLTRCRFEASKTMQQCIFKFKLLHASLHLKRNQLYVKNGSRIFLE